MLNQLLKDGTLGVEGFLIRLALSVPLDEGFTDEDTRENAGDAESQIVQDDISQVFESESSINLTEEQKKMISLAEELLCAICKNNRRQIMLEPCRHIAYCISCWEVYEKFRYPRDVTCPICSREVEEIIRVFVS